MAQKPNLTFFCLGLSDVKISTTYNKFVLTKWGPPGKYKTMEEVPKFVPKLEIDNARSRARVVVNLGIMIFALVSAMASIVWIKRYIAGGGKTVAELNHEKHQQYRKDFQEREAAKKAA